MPATATRIKAWSFSRYRAHQTCPLRAKLTILERREEPKGPAMKRGADLHDAIAAYLKGESTKLVKDLKPIKSELDAIRRSFKQIKMLRAQGMAPQAEEQWAFTSSWTQTEWKNWADAWVRIVLDVMWWTDEDTVRVRDWKTGKMSDKEVAEYLEQLELYALAVLLRFPHCKFVLPDLYFVDAQASYPPALDLVFTQKDVPRLKKTWNMRVKKMLADTKFPAKPGWQCPGCYFNHSETMGWKEKVAKPKGPCKY
jgi:hypothetical protein